MRFFLLSDLHLDKSNTSTKERLQKLCKEIRKSISPPEFILFIFLGDIANSGDKHSFITAKNHLDLIKLELNQYSLKFEFVPGNHDLVSNNENLHDFDQFIAYYGCNHSFSTKSTYSHIYEDVNFIFTDSNLSRIYDSPGRLDIDAIRLEIKPDLQNILFCHHALFHNYGGTHDTISNSHELSRQLSDLNISFLFHGHTHLSDITIPSESLTEIGCGSIGEDVRWKDGIFHQFCVGYILNKQISYIQRYICTNDGNSFFAHSQLYPKILTFEDPNTIDKISYPPIAEYIQRTVSPYEFTTKDYFSRLFSKETPTSLYDALIHHKKLLLMCDAGIGKSTELKHLAHTLSTNIYFPFFFPLANYTGIPILDLLPEQYKKLSPNYYVLLFDGYDELSAVLRDQFKRNMNQFIASHPDIHVVISSRSNFCKSETSNISHTLPDFRIFTLNALTPSEIRNFLHSNNIDSNRFENIASEKSVTDLLSNPFYLIQLSKIFSTENTLPKKSDLMETLVYRSFEVDERRSSDNLEDQYYYLLKLLEQLAFTMQVMHRQKLDDHTEYQRLFPNINDRNLLKESGLFKRTGTSWSFLHNNFREYLAARYLANLPQEKAIEIFSEGNNIKPNWVNTLGYLTNLQLKWSLFDWLSSNIPSALVKFETDRVEEETRLSIFKQIFSKYEDRQLHLRDELCDAEDLAHFLSSNNGLSFLLNRITTPKNLYSQYNAINILRYYSKLFGRNEEVHDVLINCCKNATTHKTVCRLAIYALYQLNLYSQATTRQLIDLFKYTQEDFIRLGMYEYLISTSEQNNYVHFFIDGLQYTEHKFNNDNNRISNEFFELIDGLKCMSTPESIGYVLEYFIQNPPPNFYQSQEVLSSIITNAIQLYKDTHIELYDVVLKCYINALSTSNRQLEQESIRFFVATNTQYDAIISVLKDYENEPHRFVPLITASPSTINKLAEAYSSKTLPSHIAFQNIVIRCIRDEFLYEKYAVLVQKIDNVTLPEYQPPIDYQYLEKRAVQSYFDAVLDPLLMKPLYAELLSTIDNSAIYPHQLFSVRKKFNNPSPLSFLRDDLYYYGNKVKLADFFTEIDLDFFTIHSAAKQLQSHPDITLLSKQKEILSHLVKKKIDLNIFENAITYSTDGFSYHQLIPDLLFLIQHLDIPLDEKTLLHLSEIPYIIFSEKNKQAKYQFLTTRVSLPNLRNRLIENVKKGKVKNEALQDHIEYFDSINDDALAKEAIEICKTENNNISLRSTSWKYLLNTLGIEFFCSNVLPCSDANLLLEINGAIKNIPRDQMRQFMEIQYAQSPSMQLQAHLISLGSEKAIRDYVEQIKISKHPPEGVNNIFDGPTVAIGSISSPIYLPLLEELLGVVFCKDFVDSLHPIRNLRDTLTQALINCGKNAPQETIQLIESHQPDASENIEIFRQCNYMINEIERSQCISQDVPMSLEKAMIFLSQA